LTVFMTSILLTLKPPTMTIVAPPLNGIKWQMVQEVSQYSLH
jgi:hypothetical protein